MCMGVHVCENTGDPISTSSLVQRLALCVQHGNKASVMETLPSAKDLALTCIVIKCIVADNILILFTVLVTKVLYLQYSSCYICALNLYTTRST